MLVPGGVPLGLTVWLGGPLPLLIDRPTLRELAIVKLIALGHHRAHDRWHNPSYHIAGVAHRGGLDLPHELGGRDPDRHRDAGFLHLVVGAIALLGPVAHLDGGKADDVGLLVSHDMQIKVGIAKLARVAPRAALLVLALVGHDQHEGTIEAAPDRAARPTVCLLYTS